MSDQALGVLVDAIEVLRTRIRTKLMQAGPEDQPEEPQKLFDVICRSLKRLALDPEGIDMVIHPPPSPETDDRAVVILTVDGDVTTKGRYPDRGVDMSYGG
jgi:hypothetical protein